MTKHTFKFFIEVYKHRNNYCILIFQIIPEAFLTKIEYHFETLSKNKTKLTTF